MRPIIYLVRNRPRAKRKRGADLAISLETKGVDPFRQIRVEKVSMEGESVSPNRWEHDLSLGHPSGRKHVRHKVLAECTQFAYMFAYSNKP